MTSNPLPSGLYTCPTCEGNINITRLQTHGVCVPCHDGQGIRMKKISGAWVPHDENGSPITTFCRQCSAPARVNPLGLCEECSPAENPATAEAKPQAAAARNAIWKELSDIAYELQPHHPEGIISADPPPPNRAL